MKRTAEGPRVALVTKVKHFLKKLELKDENQSGRASAGMKGKLISKTIEMHGG